MRWLCFKTNAREEFLAEAFLLSKGFRVLMPFYKNITILDIICKRLSKNKYLIPICIAITNNSNDDILYNKYNRPIIWDSIVAIAMPVIPIGLNNSKLIILPVINIVHIVNNVRLL